MVVKLFTIIFASLAMKKVYVILISIYRHTNFHFSKKKKNYKNTNLFLEKSYLKNLLASLVVTLHLFVYFCGNK